MKKFSINLLKVSLLLILGLCVFSVGNEVRAYVLLVKEQGTYSLYEGELVEISMEGKKLNNNPIYIDKFFVYEILNGKENLVDGFPQGVDSPEQDYTKLTSDDENIEISTSGKKRVQNEDANRNGGYYDATRIKFNRTGIYKIDLAVHTYDTDGTVDYDNFLLSSNYEEYCYTFEVKELPEDQRVISSNIGTIYLNKSTGDAAQISYKNYKNSDGKYDVSPKIFEKLEELNGRIIVKEATSTADIQIVSTDTALPENATIEWRNYENEQKIVTKENVKAHSVYYVWLSNGWYKVYIVDMELQIFDGNTKLSKTDGKYHLAQDTTYTLKIKPTNNALPISNFHQPNGGTDNLHSYINDITKIGNVKAENENPKGANTISSCGDYYEINVKDSTLKTGNKDAEFILELNRQFQDKLKVWSYIYLTADIVIDGEVASADDSNDLAAGDNPVAGNEEVTLTMKFNGGVKNGAPGVTQDTQTVKKGAVITFRRDNLTKENHTLVGWKLEGSENEIDFNHGANKTNNQITMDTNKTVIAVWKPIVEGNDPATGDNPAIGDDLASADLGFMGVILNLISSIISFLANNVLPLVKPMLETTVKTVGPLVTDILTGIMN